MTQLFSKNLCMSIALLLATTAYSATPNAVVATVNVGLTPAGIAITPDNAFAYVANNNNNGIVGGDTVSVINLANNTLATTISGTNFNEPYTVTINPDGTKAYVTNSNSTTINIIDIATNIVTGTISGFDGPSGMVITPDGLTGYVNNYGGPEGAQSGFGTTINVVDLNSNTITGTITVDQAPAALAITPDGAYVYVANYVNGNPGAGTVQAIQTSDNVVTATITGFSGPFGIAITPDGAFAYVTNFGSNNFYPYGTTVSVVNINSNTIIATVDVGIQPAGIAIDPAGIFAYVSNYNTLYTDTVMFTGLTAGPGTVNIIDIATNTVLTPTIGVGLSPANIAIAPNGKYVYVTNYTSNTVSVIGYPDFSDPLTAAIYAKYFSTPVPVFNLIPN